MSPKHARTHARTHRYITNITRHSVRLRSLPSSNASSVSRPLDLALLRVYIRPTDRPTDRSTRETISPPADEYIYIYVYIYISLNVANSRCVQSVSYSVCLSAMKQHSAPHTRLLAGSFVICRSSNAIYFSSPPCRRSPPPVRLAITRHRWHGAAAAAAALMVKLMKLVGVVAYSVDGRHGVRPSMIFDAAVRSFARYLAAASFDISMFNGERRHFNTAVAEAAAVAATAAAAEEHCSMRCMWA